MEKNNTLEKINKAIIIGCGRMGAAIGLKMSEMGKDVTVIDQDESAFRKLSKAYGGNSIIGDGTNIAFLRENEISESDLVVCATNDDNTNIFIALMVANIIGVKHVYVRVYDNDQVNLLSKYKINVICPSELSVTAFIYDFKREGTEHENNSN